MLVVGESARAQNFGLNGYARETNPRLKAEEGLINFSNVHSCGTETAVSVPCMFSNLGRADYSDARAPRKAFSMCCSAQACGSCGGTTSPAARAPATASPSRT